MDVLHGKKLILKEQEVLAEVAFKKKNLILFYFSTQDSKACAAFEPKLKEIYEQAMLKKVELGIVAVSGDTDKAAYKAYLNHYKDWYCLTQKDQLSQILIYNYGVTHVPTLVVVRKNGTVVTRNGVRDIEEIGINVLVAWHE